ncbi:MAG TPA: cytidine deaminase, partial [Pirellulales bacterium]
LLLSAARQAAERAYCPFSRFRVGAALWAEGRIFLGCNVENRSYGLSMCAERTAIFHAVSEGVRKLDAIAVCCLDAPSDSPPEFRSPCGACRQVIAEFASPDLPILVDGAGLYLLRDLLPVPFTL